ncbi:MAG: TonB-dependent receptor [Pyrinomonadaceae bacterium]|nr:TonB-dependent receptor [Pyrinomonadaceae bacterium]
MRIHPSLLSFILMFTFAALALAQQTRSIAGRVRDPQGAGVSNATVKLYARERPTLRLTATTDGTGVYRFQNLAPGEYIIEVESPGFARARAQDVRVEQGATTTTLDIRLELTGVSAEVVVTASGTAQPVEEVSKVITVIGRREIDERDEFSIAEALRTVPGLRVQQLGGPGRLTSIRTRGLRSQDTAVLIDGSRFRDPSAPQGDASSFLSDLIVTDVERIEVLRGSGSSLYGTNAIGGVVNIVTDEGGGPTRGNVLLEGGSLGLFRGQAQMAGGTDANRLIYSLGISHLNVARGVDRDDAARNTSGQGRILFNLTPTATLSGRIYASDAFVQLNESPDIIGALPASGIVQAVPLAWGELRRFEAGTPRGGLNVDGATFIPGANDPDSSQASRFFSGVVTFAQRPAETFGYTISYQGLRTKRTNRNGPGGIMFQPLGNTLLDYEGRVQTLNARTDFQIGKFNFINAGYEFETESFDNQAFPVSSSFNSRTEVTQQSNTLFVQDQLRLIDDRLQLSAAFRAQFFSLKNPLFAPAATAPYQGISFEAPPNAYTGDGSIAYIFRSTKTKLRAHVGNGYRAPSLYERFGTFFGSFGYSAYGDPRLRPERSIAFDAGVDQSFGNNRVRASATYFYTRLQEVIGFNAVGLNDPFRRFSGYSNAGGGLARGAEFSVTAQPSRTLDLFASYTYTNSDQRAPQNGVISVFVIPDHQFSVVATQRIGPRFALNFDLVAASDHLFPLFQSVSPFAARVYRFDGLVKADLGASYTLPLTETRRVRFFGRADNIFDREQYEGGFHLPGRTIRAGAAFSF